MTAIPRQPPAEVLAFNQAVEEAMAGLPAMWDVGVVAARQSREEGRSIFGELPLSPRARWIAIPGPAGPLRLRVIDPTGDGRGIYFHVHGGGFVVGGAHHHDPMLERLADSTGMTVASVEYRLAPEDPYPAGPDDCEAAVLWLLEHGPAELGGDPIAIGGESAGAHLAAVTLLRLRDRHDLTPFRAALLTYGLYDLRGTPTSRSFGDRPLILSTPLIEWMVEQFLQGTPADDPDVSPLFADLAGLPTALFTVGELDPLLDDSLFMAARWQAAGSGCRLDVWPGAIHAFDYFDNDYGLAARARMHDFLNEMLR